MKNPYEILDVPRDCSDAEVKQAYLKKVKQYPPDREHKQFQRIHQAYNTLKDRKSRLRHGLFSEPVVDFDGLIDQALDNQAFQGLTPDSVLAILQAGIDEKTLQNILSSIDKS